MEDLKEIIELDFESIITNDKAEGYREEYELYKDMLSCWDGITLKEFTYCKENGIDDCEFIRAKYNVKCCYNCNEKELIGAPILGVSMLPYIVMILTLILAIVMNIIF